MTTYNYRLKLYDLLKKTKTKHYFDFFLSTLDWNKKELYAYRLAKLRELVAYARTHCAYYRDIFDKNNIVSKDRIIVCDHHNGYGIQQLIESEGGIYKHAYPSGQNLPYATIDDIPALFKK